MAVSKWPNPMAMAATEAKTATRLGRRRTRAVAADVPTSTLATRCAGCLAAPVRL